MPYNRHSVLMKMLRGIKGEKFFLFRLATIYGYPHDYSDGSFLFKYLHKINRLCIFITFKC